MFNVLNKNRGRPDEPTPVITGHHISDHKQITSLLMHAYKKHVLFNASFPGHNAQFSTALLGIYDEHGFVVLDELTPRIGHRLFLKEKKINLSGRLEGVEMQFSTHLNEAREKGGIAFYKIRMPESVYYRQRRHDFRIASTGANISFHGLRGKGVNQMLKGYVSDISRSGVGVMLEDDVTLDQGEVLSSCIISMPGEGEVTFSMEVRFCFNNNRAQVTRIGGRYLEIDNASLRKIAYYISELERARARRLHGVHSTTTS